ncbi:MAG: glycerol-3-phosphate acyltransferase PlsY [Gammaproteobacteria bacterium]|jgi:glycerol-3-phosphate acyltransferase PlsY
MIINILAIVSAYLLGSLSAAILVCKVMGLSDPRKGGSGNPGATNVYRLHGTKAGSIALFGDLIKGVLPILVSQYIGVADWVIAVSGIAVFLGHTYPIFFHFKGGKGVATLLGVLLATSWLVGLLFIFSWALIAILFRYSSAAGMTAAMLAPVYAIWLTPDMSYVGSFTVMALFLLVRHRKNIERLLAGTESRIGAEKKHTT